MLVTLSVLGATAQGYESVAFNGDPVGVGQVRIELKTPELLERWQLDGIGIIERSDRIFYPIVSARGLLDGISQLVGVRSERPATIEITFLFSGDESLSIEIPGQPQASRELVPIDRPDQHRQLLSSWWRESSRRDGEGDYAPLTDIYLNAVHHRRLPTLPLSRSLTVGAPALRQATWLDLLDGRRGSRQRDFVMAARGLGERKPADHPVEETRPFESAESVPEIHDQNQVEPVLEEAASYVPSDCYYIRFGEFSNLLWMLNLIEQKAGELGRLVTLRSRALPYGDRIQQQLAVRELPFAEYLGDTMIADAALVGHDFYFQDGPAIGIMLKARNPLLPVGLKQLRAKVQREAADQGAALTTFEYKGRQVSKLSTPDNQLRSFYASRGDWQLITNSQAMIERFVTLNTNSDEVLANDPLFRFARSLQPAEPKAIDVFLGKRFFATWNRRSYRAEADRRRLAAAELLVMELAVRAYRYEVTRGGWPGESLLPDPPGSAATPLSIERLINERLLPDQFGQRCDGSHPVLQSNMWIDSLRGVAGSFLPVPDVQVIQLTDRERRGGSLSVDKFDPLFARIRRTSRRNQQGQVVNVEAYAFPAPRGFDLLALVAGTPTSSTLATDADMWLKLEVVLNGVPIGNHEGNRHLLIGVLDRQTEHVPDELALERVPRLVMSAPMFRASWPAPRLLNGVLKGRRGRAGVAAWRGPLGIWRRQIQDIHLQSTQRAVVDEVALSLRTEMAPRPAQVRFAVKDLQTAQLAGWLQSIASRRGLQASVNNVRALHELMYRFELPAEEARLLAARLYGGSLVCPLGGELAGRDWDSGGPGFASSAWNCSADGPTLEPDVSTVPAVFRWFQGASGSVRAERDVVHAVLEINLAE